MLTYYLSKMPSKCSFCNSSEFPHRPFLEQLDDPFGGGMSTESRRAYQLVPPRPYLSVQDPRTNLTQHGGTHHPYSHTLTSWDGLPYNASTGSSSQSGQQDDGVMMGTSDPSNIGTEHPGGSVHDQSSETAYPSQTQLWAKLRHISIRITNLVEAETQHTQVIDWHLYTIETHLNTLKSTLVDADISHAKKAGGMRGSSNKHPMLKVSRLRYDSPQMSQNEVLGSL